jgi:ParB family chromosome partitioning protein
MVEQHNRHRALGKGLSALISAAPSVNVQQVEKNVIFIPINKIQPNPYQPRATFQEESIKELAESIRIHGILQPIIVTYGANDEYQIIAGERRLLAAKHLGLTEVPAIVKKVTPQEHLILSLIENLQREDLNPIEEAQGYQQLIDEFGLTQEELARYVGKTRPYIANTLRILKLPEEVKDLVASGKISPAHARTLVGIEDEKLLEKLVDRIMLEGLTVRELEFIKGSLPKSRKKRSAGINKPPEAMLLEDELQKVFATKVRICGNDKKGKIEIYYFSLDDFNRILKLLRR